MYKRYQGNTGLVRRVEEAAPPGRSLPPRPGGYVPPPPPPPPGLLGRLGALLPGLRAGLETEDLLLLLILYLLYRESGDGEYLLALAAMVMLE